MANLSYEEAMRLVKQRRAQQAGTPYATEPGVGVPLGPAQYGGANMQVPPGLPSYMNPMLSGLGSAMRNPALGSGRASALQQLLNSLGSQRFGQTGPAQGGIMGGGGMAAGGQAGAPQGRLGEFLRRNLMAQRQLGGIMGAGGMAAGGMAAGG